MVFEWTINLGSLLAAGAAFAAIVTFLLSLRNIRETSNSIQTAQLKKSESIDDKLTAMMLNQTTTITRLDFVERSLGAMTGVLEKLAAQEVQIQAIHERLNEQQARLNGFARGETRRSLQGGN